MDKRIYNIPHLGQRIIKTSIAVFICLLVCYLIGYRGAQMPSEACITAIICMQPQIRDTRQYAVNRVIGTLVGSVWGLLLILLLSAVPAATEHYALLYLLMAIGMMLSIYTAVLLGKSDTSGLAAIVFLC
ncbi:MAG: FUSC family protein, partial [Firmicutes bacterium]|nr:FUSC family protein [Bacillota bacterium]